jgi:hypothetical protein
LKALPTPETPFEYFGYVQLLCMTSDTFLLMLRFCTMCINIHKYHRLI